MPDTHRSDAPDFRTDLHTGTDHDDDARRFQRAFPGDERIALRAEPTWDDGGFGPAYGAHGAQGALSGGRGDASGRGGAHGHPLRQARGRGDLERPNFNLDVPPNGYAWWYVDGIADPGPDGTPRAISIIGFIGSVFSPWYAWSGRRDPENHVCINVATYGPGGRFTMTDRGRSALRQTVDEFTVGPSAMSWQGDRLVIDVDEIGAPPMVGPVHGRIVVTPTAITDVEVPLTPEGTHVWRPFAPTARIQVDLDARGWQWEGHGYFDANFGTRALEQDFTYWNWGRFPRRGGSSCFYDATRRDGSGLGLGVHFDADGTAELMRPPPKTTFRRSLWAVHRETRADPGVMPRQVQNMLDAPFYSRSAVRTQLHGDVCEGVHEALDLRRFRSPLLKPMLAVRVPRRANWRFS